MKKSQSSSLYRLSRLGILGALCVVLRYAFASLPNVQPVTAIFFIVAVRFGLTDSIAVMAVTMLVSSFLLGFGPWVFWQLLAFAVVLVIWRFLAYPLTRFSVIAQAIAAGLLSFAYGMVIDSCYAFLYSMPWWTYVMAGASFNLAHALSTGLFYPMITSLFRRLTHEKTA